MPDSPDQMIYTLQQENKSLKKILKEKEKKLQQKGRELQQKGRELQQKGRELQQKGRALEQKDRELDLERSLWKSRDGSWDAGKWSALHRLEVLDDIIRDGDKLRQATLADGPKFPVHAGAGREVPCALRPDAAVPRRRAQGPQTRATDASCT